MAKKNKNSIDLPDVSDIPGQEHIRAPRLGELADNTASSADEEGDDILNQNDEDDDLVMGNDGDVTADERSTLAHIDSRRADSEDEVLRESALDEYDDDGDPLNEDDSDLTGDDLDVPGSDGDDSDEEIGEEDEENNDYSLSDDDDHEEREDYGTGRNED